MARLIGSEPFHGYPLRGGALRLRRQGGLPRGESSPSRSQPAPTRRPRARGRCPRAPAERAEAMRIAMIGTGYVGLVSGACFSRVRHRRRLRRQGCRARSHRLQQGEIPIYEPGLERAGRRQRQGRPPRPSRPISPARWRRRRRVHRRRHADAARRRPCRSDLRLCRRRGDRRRDLDGYTVVVTKSTVPVGTGREVARIIREAQPARRVRRRLQSGVPARGLGDRRLHAARPRRDRRRERARARGHAPRSTGRSI